MSGDAVVPAERAGEDVEDRKGALTRSQSTRIEDALRTARAETGVLFSVFLGDVAPGPGGSVRAAAERLHAALGADADDAALVVVAPGLRRVEVVTGAGIHRRVDDRAAALAVLSMTTAFAVGDLVGGVVTGVQMLADAAGRRHGVHGP